LSASTDATASSDDTVVSTLTLPKINLRGSGSRKLTLKFDRPGDVPDGSYEFIASATAVGTGTAPAEAVTATPVTIASPKVDLATAFADGSPISLDAGHHSTVTLTVRNAGNVTASGTLDMTLFGSADAALDDTDTVLATLPARRIRIRPGKAVTIHIHLPAGVGGAGGTNFVLASASSSIQPADDNSSNDLAAAPVA
jgi:hypothetical protein